ncbi:DUF1345 domain-containing protein [Amnibacterium sp. CER49]|uniref:DUF1345 domain-containing protein n=1 Tax=Amnibacterium sp. CER49 TaxID=3039161 RepID=UPI0024477D7A|nr:DUF1345 domain-containing protein [Amnibacterium sp. CER49]MDH2443552.1 DUF1345 domain-containing protein [Amnibacterium sp. CER49]
MSTSEKQGHRSEAPARDESATRRRTVLRLTVTVIAGLLAGGITALLGGWRIALDVGWVAAAGVYLLWTWIVIGNKDADETARAATRQNPHRSTADFILLIASVASLVAVVGVLAGAKSTAPGIKDLLALLALVSVALSWLVVHTLFTLRYAELYYSGPDGGVSFNQDEPPRYVEFAYLAFTVGMTFQVSDTDIQTGVMRATILRHALLSYVFGAVVLASTVNLLAGLAG